MARTMADTDNCSIARSLGVLGAKWTFLIIRESFYGSTKFDEFSGALGCPANLLSERLKLLVEEGVLVRSEYREPGSRTRSEYLLTEKGRRLAPILLALREWGDTYEADPPGPPVLTRHRRCGAKVRLELVCGAGHYVADVEDLELVDGPGAVGSRFGAAS